MALLWLVLCASVDFGLSEKVLLISMDGFRWDYTHKVSTPVFDMMAENGSRAEYINNTFTTLTFPCHYSIVTGLYEESNGLVGNEIYDPEYNEVFSMKSKETKWWNQAEPIWVTARKHGLKSAVYFWPGSETEINGFRPNIWMPYNQSIPFNKRIDTVVEWLSNDTLSIDLALLYFHEPDYTAHTNGTDSKELLEMVEEMDSVLGSILRRLDNAGLTDIVNVIVTSDHGMTDIDPESKVISLNRYIDILAIKVLIESVSPIVNILPHEGYLAEMYDNLTVIPHMRVFLKDNIPDRWHYRNNRRILPLLLVADEGWIIEQSNASLPLDERATHGYDNQLSSMKPIFYAKGPRIRKNFEVDPFNSVDIYPFMCNLLGIPPSPNNGSLDIVNRMIDENKPNDTRTFPSLLLVLILLTSSVIVLASFVVFIIAYKKIQSSKQSCVKGDKKYSYLPLQQIAY